jgi:hypothetical protein
VLGELGDEVQGVEDLEVAGHAVEVVGAGGIGEALVAIKMAVEAYRTNRMLLWDAEAERVVTA